MENDKQNNPNKQYVGMLAGEENMTPAEYCKACKEAVGHAFGMQEIPPEQWHDEWD